ncbi:MAG: hypothetical protein HY291_13090 [Planctomycetes bacterium]|nr:hypothetical protein [Planctomycetota bacterium]
MDRSTGMLTALLLCVLILQREALAQAKQEEKVAAQKNEVPKEATVASNASVAPAKALPGANGSGAFQSAAPVFSLKDPHGKEFRGDDLIKKNGMLLMLTVPNLSQYEKQVRWQRYLKKEAWPKEHTPACVLLQDMSQQETFKEKARSIMKEKYDPTAGVVVLVDETGDVRRKFGVSANETVILVVDAKGRIVHHEADDSEADAESAKRVMNVVRAMASANAAVAPATPPLAAALTPMLSTAIKK